MEQKHIKMVLESCVLSDLTHMLFKNGSTLNQDIVKGVISFENFHVNMHCLPTSCIHSVA